MTAENEDRKFDRNIRRKLHSYVYTIVDPRDGKVFYVGKGRGGRGFDHEVGARNVQQEIEEKLEEMQVDARLQKEDSSTDELKRSIEETIDKKNNRIREIIAAGKEPQYFIHRHGLIGRTALEVEAALIDAYPDLTNQQAGYGAKRGRQTMEQIRERYVMDDPKDHGHSVLALFVGSIYDRTSDDQPDQPDEVYNAARWSWEIDPNRAGEVDYIFAMEGCICMEDSICRGVFVADRWAPATRENFEKIPPNCVEDPERYGFDGEWASEEIWKLYVGKILPKGLRRKQDDENPVWYL